MLFTLSTLPQLAVSAKLLCLLMIVICGAVPPIVRSLQLYSVSTHNFVGVNNKGRVYVSNRSDEYSNLTLISVSFDELRIFSERTGKYICFSTTGRLLATSNMKGLYCEFHEHMTPMMYTTFQSTRNKTYYMGFKRNGRPMKYHHQNGSKPCPKHCCDFMKRTEGSSIDNHNKKVQMSKKLPDQIVLHHHRHYRHRAHRG